MKYKIMIISLVLLLGLTALADQEFWTTDTFQFKLGNNSVFNIIPELRFRDQGRELYYWHTYLGPTFVLSDNFELNLFYGLKFSEKAQLWPANHLLYFDLIGKLGSIKNRTRIEQDLTASITKCREMLQVKFSGWFLSEEIFIDLTDNYLSEGRSSLGYTYKLSGRTEAYLSYLLRRQKSSAQAEWTWTNVLGAGIKVFTLN